MNSVQKISNDNLCIGCGVCSSICPKNAISYELTDGIYQCTVNKGKCIECGLCMRVCPSVINLDIDISKKDNFINYVLGKDYIKSLVVASKNEDIIKRTTSGGFITTLLMALLKKKKYSKAFIVDNYNYNKQIFAKGYTCKNLLEKTPKSRYVPVSHYETAKYICEHKDEKIIIVATSCAIKALLNLIELKKLNRDNYLLVGLFCDKTLTYNVQDYFFNHPRTNKREILNLYFRSKDSKGWPGDLKIEFKDKTSLLMDKSERICVKDYFCPEKCLYCLDKLNMYADFSVGDNYTNCLLNTDGSNSIIIRTERAVKIWKDIKDSFTYKEIEKNKLVLSQHINDKYDNVKNIKQKESSLLSFKNIDKLLIEKQDIIKYNDSLSKIKLGSEGNNKIIYFKSHSFLYKVIKKVKPNIVFSNISSK